MMSRKDKMTNPISLYLTQHWQALIIGSKWLISSPFTTLMTLIVIGVAIALPTGMLAIFHNVKEISHHWQQSAQISLYLKSNVNPSTIQTTLEQLQHQPNIKKVQYISPEQGLANFSEESEFGDILKSLPNNPLPGVIVVYPTSTAQTPQAMQDLLNTLQQLPIIDQTKLDLGWVKKLYSIMQLGQRGLYALSLLLGFGVMFIIGNTINLATQRYRKEIEVYKLSGATDSFVRRPFLYSGFWYGIAGGGLAWLFVDSVLWCLKTPVNHLAMLYDSQFKLYGLNLSQSVLLFLIGIALGLAASWLTVNHHLHTPSN